MRPINLDADTGVALRASNQPAPWPFCEAACLPFSPACFLALSFSRDTGFGTTLTGAADTSPRVDVLLGAVVAAALDVALGDTNWTNTSPDFTIPIS